MESPPRMAIIDPTARLRVPPAMLLSVDAGAWGCSHTCPAEATVAAALAEHVSGSSRGSNEPAESPLKRCPPYVEGARLLWIEGDTAAETSPAIGKALADFLRLHDATPEAVLRFARKWGPL